MASRIIHIFAYWHDPRWKQFVGATVKIADLAKNLAGKGHKVILFLPKYNFKYISQSTKIMEIPFIDLPILRFISFNLNLFLVLLLLKKSQRPDIIYVRRMMSIVPLIYGIKLKVNVYEVNDDPYHYKNSNKKSLLKKLRSIISAKIDEINIYYCTKCFVITDSVKNRLLNYNPKLSNKKIIILPSGANTEVIKPLDRNECRKSLNIDIDKKIVGFIGSLLNHQGIQILIDSAKFVVNKISNVRFIIIGEGPMKKFWQDRVLKMNLAEKFDFVGQVNYENVARWIGTFS